MSLLCFIIGMIVGGSIGVITMALMFAARSADDAMHSESYSSRR